MCLFWPIWFFIIREIVCWESFGFSQCASKGMCGDWICQIARSKLPQSPRRADKTFHSGKNSLLLLASNNSTNSERNTDSGKTSIETTADSQNRSQCNVKKNG